tara:strand:+ start:2606 stop:3199 length:594 start_codon:yes stop_codon:yes gene_type:complete
MSNSWIHTYKGNKVWPLEARGTFCIEDIAHALSMQCRFNGATSSFYSVAEHCVRVSRITGCIHGLMHDAGEAYLPDVASPIKGHLYVQDHSHHRLQPWDTVSEGDLIELILIEQRLHEAIYEQLGLDCQGANLSAEDVRQADLVMLVTEANELMHGTTDWPNADQLPHPLERIGPSLGWFPKQAKHEFLTAFLELTP